MLIEQDFHRTISALKQNHDETNKTVDHATLFHEMLHQVHVIKVVGGRRQFHPPAFLAQERTFHEFHRARDWERRNLDRLLTY